MNHSPPGGAKIRRYQNSDRDAFISLNLDWIREYFAVENTDREQLDGLETTILAREGKIVIAELAAKWWAVVPSHLHLAAPKMGFGRAHQDGNKKARPRKRYRTICLGTVDPRSQRTSADAIWLETNSILEPTIHLYESVGFRHLPHDEFWPTPYARCSVQMVLHL